MSWQGPEKVPFTASLRESHACLVSNRSPWPLMYKARSASHARMTSTIPSHLRSRRCYFETCRWGQWGLKTQARVPSITQLGRARIWAHVWQWESEDGENVTNVHEIIFSRCAPWNRRNACIGSPSTGACKIPIVIENLVTKEKPKTSTSKPMNYRACKRMNFLRNNLISTKGTGYGNRMQSLSKDDHSIRVGHLKSPKAAQQQTSNEKWLNGVHCAYKEDRQVAESVGRAP